MKYGGFFVCMFYTWWYISSIFTHFFLKIVFSVFFVGFFSGFLVFRSMNWFLFLFIEALFCKEFSLSFNFSRSVLNLSVLKMAPNKKSFSRFLSSNFFTQENKICWPHWGKFWWQYFKFRKGHFANFLGSFFFLRF